jgi:hypothetical protein
MTTKSQIREPKLCPECGYLLHFRADSVGLLVAYCEGCEVAVGLIPEAGSASGASKSALANLFLKFRPD